MTNLQAQATQVVERMRTHGVVPPSEWASHLSRALRVPSLDVVSPQDPGRLIEAHFAFMDAQVDDVTTIVYLEAVDALLRQRDGTTSRPALLELMTLLDDVRVLDLDRDGWATRRELASRYLQAAGIDLAAVEDLDAVMEADLLCVATTGLRRIQRHAVEASALGLRFTRLQRDHYHAALRFLAVQAQTNAVQALAAHLLDAAGPMRG